MYVDVCLWFLLLHHKKQQFTRDITLPHRQRNYSPGLSLLGIY